jgi:hypothetical protein
VRAPRVWPVQQWVGRQWKRSATDWPAR